MSVVRSVILVTVSESYLLENPLLFYSTYGYFFTHIVSGQIECFCEKYATLY